MVKRQEITLSCLVVIGPLFGLRVYGDMPARARMADEVDGGGETAPGA